MESEKAHEGLTRDLGKMVRDCGGDVVRKDGEGLGSGVVRVTKVG